MDEGTAVGGVALSRGVAASVLLHEVLAESVAEFPGVFSELGFVDSPVEFRAKYHHLLPWFEAARSESPDRLLIAESLIRAAASRIVWKSNDSEIPLIERVAEDSAPLDLQVRSLGTNGGLTPRVPWDGAPRTGSDLVDLATSLVDSGLASQEVLEGVRWVVEEAGTDGISLRDRRIVVMGAGAELAPTRLLLEGGAEVLWVDLGPPPEELWRSEGVSGALHWIDGGADLLTQPSRIRATVAEFAGEGTVDIGLYAYAPGHTREWRLTAAMNAIVDTLPPEMVRTVTLLISPTASGVLSPSDLEREARRREDRPVWQGLLRGVGLLGRGRGHVRVGSTCTNRGILPVQGTSYAAAQYLGKLIPAEVWATSHSAHSVSANTAGVSRTGSLSHPVFDTAFEGAAAFAVATFEPETTATLNGLLTIRDWLAPQPIPTGVDNSARAKAVTSTRVHGGIYNLPYPLDRALGVAAGLGAVKHPGRLVSMLRR